MRGPKHVVKTGKTRLTAAETRELLDAIDTDVLVGLRDRALIGLMVYSVARVSAAVGMTVADYFTQPAPVGMRQSLVAATVPAGTPLEENVIHAA